MTGRIDEGWRSKRPPKVGTPFRVRWEALLRAVSVLPCALSLRDRFRRSIRLGFCIIAHYASCVITRVRVQVRSSFKTIRTKKSVSPLSLRRSPQSIPDPSADSRSSPFPPAIHLPRTMGSEESEIEVHGKSEAVQIRNSNNCLADLVFDRSLLPVPCSRSRD